jgi:predicted amidohydrolase
MRTLWKMPVGIGVVAVAMLVTPLFVRGMELDKALEAKKQGKTGSRLVGVSCICQPPYSRQEQMEKWIDTAALDKPDLILLTEGCMHNAPRSAPQEQADATSDPLPEPGPITQFLARKAKQHHCYIIASYWRKNLKGPGRFNSAVLIDRQGKVVGWYDKMFPTIGEMERGILPGHGAVVFDTDFGRIGALICYDLNFDELLAQYKEQGAELLCFLSNYRGGDRVPGIALNNHCFFASSVPAENGVIVDPLGRTLAESSNYGRIIFARINLDSKVVHIDYNIDRVRQMKEKYGPAVKIEVASPEAYYYITSLHPDVSVEEMIKEFEVETLEDYLNRARSVRLQHLPKESVPAQK